MRRHHVRHAQEGRDRRAGVQVASNIILRRRPLDLVEDPLRLFVDLIRNVGLDDLVFFGRVGQRVSDRQSSLKDMGDAQLLQRCDGLGVVGE